MPSLQKTAVLQTDGVTVMVGNDILATPEKTRQSFPWHSTAVFRWEGTQLHQCQPNSVNDHR